MRKFHKRPDTLSSKQERKITMKMKMLIKGHIYYMVYFDGMLASGRKASKEIKNMFESDKTFELNEFEKCMEYVNKLRENKCDYAFYIEEWNEEDETIEHLIGFKWLKH